MGNPAGRPDLRINTDDVRRAGDLIRHESERLTKRSPDTYGGLKDHCVAFGDALDMFGQMDLARRKVFTAEIEVFGDAFTSAAGLTDATEGASAVAISSVVVG